MSSPRQQIIELIEQDALPAEKIPQALTATGVRPDYASWRRCIDLLLLWLGALSLAFASLFFIAYNWEEMGRFAKFGMVEALMVLAVAAYCKLGEDKVAAKAALFMSSIFLGVLLALYGQVYQTGADPWQLFCTWAVLMLPWAVAARFPALWIVWLVLVNVAIILYHRTFGSIFWTMLHGDTGMLWLLFMVNTGALVTWEILSQKWSWLSERWSVRLIAVGSGISLSWLVLDSIFIDRGFSVMPAIVWAAWLYAMYLVYRKIRPDLFMLAGCCLSVIVVVVSFLSKYLLNDFQAGGFLILSFVILTMGTSSAFWLRKIHQESIS